MKKLLLTPLFVILGVSSIQAEDGCTYDQIIKMQKQNLSQESIDLVCNKRSSSSASPEDKSNFIQPDTVEQDSYIQPDTVEPNTQSETPKKATDTYDFEQEYVAPEIEHFFWKVGVGSFAISDSDFSETSLNAGLQYFPFGLANSGLGIGYSASYASSDVESGYYTNTIEETTSEIEILFNIAFDSGASLTPVLITGTISQSLTNSYNDETLKQSSDISGYGLYFNFSNIVKSGSGLSLYYKNLEIDESDSSTITLIGLQLTW